MTTIYVLIVLWTGHYRYSDSLTQEFTSLERCQSAATAVKDNIETNGDRWLNQSAIVSIGCYEK